MVQQLYHKYLYLQILISSLDNFLDKNGCMLVVVLITEDNLIFIVVKHNLDVIQIYILYMHTYIYYKYIYKYT